MKQCDEFKLDQLKNDHKRNLAIDLAAEQYRKDEFDHFQAILDDNREYPLKYQAEFFDYKMLQDLQYELTARDAVNQHREGATDPEKIELKKKLLRMRISGKSNNSP